MDEIAKSVFASAQSANGPAYNIEAEMQRLLMEFIPGLRDDANDRSTNNSTSMSSTMMAVESTNPQLDFVMMEQQMNNNINSRHHLHYQKRKRTAPKRSCSAATPPMTVKTEEGGPLKYKNIRLPLAFAETYKLTPENSIHFSVLF